MNRILLFALLLLSLNVWSSGTITVTIKEVGLSMNTGRVFIVTDESSSDTDTICSDKNKFSIALPDSEAYLFYSAALTAKNNEDKMRIIYSDSKCISNSPIVEVFWNL